MGALEKYMAKQGREMPEREEEEDEDEKPNRPAPMAGGY